MRRRITIALCCLLCVAVSWQQRAYGAAAPITGNGLNGPTGIALAGDQVWVTNENGNSVSIFTPPSGAPSPGGGLARVRTVFLIMMENHDWSEIAGNLSAPYINDTLLPMASSAGAYYDPSGYHSSLTDYLWLEGGQCYQCYQYCGWYLPAVR